jgi:hypothetical protein
VPEKLTPERLHYDCPRRYEAVDIATENIGTIHVERRRSRKRDVARLLDEMLAFVRGQKAETLTLTLG